MLREERGKVGGFRSDFEGVVDDVGLLGAALLKDKSFY